MRSISHGTGASDQWEVGRDHQCCSQAPPLLRTMVHSHRPRLIMLPNQRAADAHLIGYEQRVVPDPVLLAAGGWHESGANAVQRFPLG